MKIDNTLPDAAVEKEIGRRIAAIRLGRNLSQEEVATRSRVSLRRLQRLERGQSSTQLSGFLRVCRTLGLLDRIDALLAEPAASPMEQLQRHEQPRQRASRRKTGQRARAEPWRWGSSS